jgi:Lectin C-type domain
MVALLASSACNYDFDAFAALAPPLLDGGSTAESGSGSAGRAGAGGGGSGKAGAGGDAAIDAGKGSGNGGAAGSGPDGSSGSSGSTGSGGTAGAGAAGSGGAGGAAGGPGSGGGGAGGGPGGTGGSGTGGSSVDAGGGAGGGGPDGSGAGGTATGGSGGNGTGGTGTGGASGSGSGGIGGAGAGGGGTGGGVPPGDGGVRADVRADSSGDAPPTFNCASVGGRIYENHCYYAMTPPVSWEVAAKQSCAAPAHLVTITSAAEHNFVISILADESRWIGYYRPAGSPTNPSAFEWVTGENTTYRQWYSANGEPDYDGACVRLGPSNHWGDHPCTGTFAAICERE